VSARLFNTPASERSVLNARPPITLPTGQLPLALAGALCGPAALRHVREPGVGARARVVLIFEHQSVGRLELAVRVVDTRSQRAVRELREDPAAFARLFAVLACTLQVEGEPGRFTYEAVHRLTHGPRSPSVDRSRLNKPIADLLHLLSAATLTWTPPRGRGKRPRGTVEIGHLVTIEVLNRKARTVRLAPAARPLLMHYSVQVAPAAFLVARPAGVRARPPAPVLARLRLAALIAARFRHAQPQQMTFGALLDRFAWVTFDTPGHGSGAAEAAGRVLRPRLREAVRVLGAELRDPARYGAGLLDDVVPCSRAALRSMFALGLASEVVPLTEAAERGREQQVLQPTLEESRLRAADAAPLFAPARLRPKASTHERTRTSSLARNQDTAADSRAQGQNEPPSSLVAGQDDGQHHKRNFRASSQETVVPSWPDTAQLVTIGVSELLDGRVLLEFANGFGVVLPPEIAQAADVCDSLAHDQDEGAAHRKDSLERDQRLPRSQPEPTEYSLGGHHNRPPGFGSTPGIPPSESSSDDSERARGERLPAPLAPPTSVSDPPPGSTANPVSTHITDQHEHLINERRSA
jgi:hypothetical protein